MDIVEVVRVKFLWPGKIFEFANPNKLVLKRYDRVVVEKDNGETIVGSVAIPPRIRRRIDEDKYLNSVVRIASEQDTMLAKVSDDFRADVKQYFNTRLAAREITGVRMVDCEKLDGGRRLVIYYQSEQRKFDPKSIAIDMSHRFKARIDLRSVGIRDAARLSGGIGKCGLSLCCSTWLPDFAQVSIRMAKDQGLSPEPEGITGQCGRLLCCLGYEHENYVELGKGMPKVGKIVVTPKGDGRVTKLDILRGTLSVRIEENGEVFAFQASEVSRKFGPGSKSADQNDESDDDSQDSSDGEGDIH